MTVIIGLLCFTAGVWFGDWAWKLKILEKIDNGTRLELRGKLYNVVPDNG